MTRVMFGAVAGVLMAASVASAQTHYELQSSNSRWWQVDEVTINAPELERAFLVVTPTSNASTGGNQIPYQFEIIQGGRSFIYIRNFPAHLIGRATPEDLRDLYTDKMTPTPISIRVYCPYGCTVSVVQRNQDPNLFWKHPNTIAGQQLVLSDLTIQADK